MPYPIQELILPKGVQLFIKALPLPIERGKRSEVERLTTLEILRAKLGQVQDIDHYSNGKPYLSAYPNLSLSISHSDEDVAVLLSDNKLNLGLDIEDRAEQVLRVRNRFLNKAEDRVVRQSEDELLALHLAWSAKECLYKAFNPKLSYFEAFILCEMELKLEERRANLVFSYEGRWLTVEAFYTDAYVLTYFSE